jgi:putative acetyltransferase
MARTADMISIELVPAVTDDVRLLVGELEQLLSAEYRPEQRHGLPLDRIFQPHIRFFVARHNGEPAGCGGVALLDGFAEVKRMYVRPALRGRGVADALLEQIEDTARDEGYDVLRLETGNTLKPALAFYRRSGFEFCDAFGDYAAMQPEAIVTSLFMQKSVKTLYIRGMSRAL